MVWCSGLDHDGKKGTFSWRTCFCFLKSHTDFVKCNEDALNNRERTVVPTHGASNIWEHSATFLLKSGMWRASEGHTTEPSCGGTCEQSTSNALGAGQPESNVAAFRASHQFFSCDAVMTKSGRSQRITCAWRKLMGFPFPDFQSLPGTRNVAGCWITRGLRGDAVLVFLSLLVRPRVSTWREHSQFLRPRQRRIQYVFAAFLICLARVAQHFHDTMMTSNLVHVQRSRATRAPACK